MNNEYKNLKKSLDDFLAKKRMKELGSDRDSIVRDTAAEVATIFKPILEAMALQGRLSKEELQTVAQDLAARINIPEISIPEIVMPTMPDITVPEPRVTVNFDAKKIRIPEVRMPDEMTVKGWVGLMGVDLDHPLPVQLRDEKGRVLNLFEGLTQVVGGGGGFARQVKINNTSSEPIPVSGTFSVSAASSTAAVPTNNEGLTYNSDNPMPVYITSGASATSAAMIVDSAAVAYSGSNPLPVMLVSGGTATTGVQLLNADGTYRDTLPVQGTVTVSSVTASIAAAIVDSTGVAFGGANYLPTSFISSTGAAGSDGVGMAQLSLLNSGGFSATPMGAANYVTNGTSWDKVRSGGYDSGGAMRVSMATDIASSVYVTGSSGSISATIVDSSGIGYSGSNPVPVLLVAGAAHSTVVVGSVVADAADDGAGPVKIGGIARQTNPTAVADGDRVSTSHDDVGRQIVRPIQVRDLIMTAYTAKATGSTFGTESTLLASGSAAFLDLIYVMATNDSTAATYVELRASTGGTVTLRLDIPANASIGFNLPVPYSAPFADHTWTVDFPDITGTNCTVSALFTKEV